MSGRSISRHPSPVGIGACHGVLDGVFGPGYVTGCQRDRSCDFACVPVKELGEGTRPFLVAADPAWMRHASYRRARVVFGYRLLATSCLPAAGAIAA